MSALIVTRHAGAVDWLRGQWIEGEVVDHLTPDMLDGVDVVIGVLPVHLAVAAHQRGCRVVLIQIAGTPPRGAEYTAEDMEEAGACLRELTLELSAADGRDLWSPQRDGIPASSWGDMQRFRIGLIPFSAADLVWSEDASSYDVRHLESE